MIYLSKDDFRPFTEFELQSRWTKFDSQVPAFALNLIRPLTHEKANELWVRLSISTNELGSYLFNPNLCGQSDSLFVSIEQYNVPLQNFNHVQNRLELFEPVREREVIVSWTKTAAVVVPWWIFCAYFEDFCYPHSDDVDVWPLTEEWALFYSHEDQLIFGKLFDLLSHNHTVTPPIDKNLENEIVPLLQANQHIAAIKLYSKRTGMRLADAKGIIDVMIRNLPKESKS